MSKVITFSRTFPSYHPKAGQPTHFVEAMMNSLYPLNLPIYGGKENCPPKFLESLTKGNVGYKHHTIRAGHRWKAGDYFSPRVWSGKPYQSKQIQFAPDIQIKKTWDFEMDSAGVCVIAKPGEQLIYTFEYGKNTDDIIAQNDGLLPEDFYFWFSRSPEFKKKKGFDGQIICWNERIEYLKVQS